MDLNLVLGMSCNNISSLSCDQTSGLVAHASSGVLVILDPDTNRQMKYLTVKRNQISSSNFSSDGKLIVTGEIGYRPAVRAWKVKDGKEIATIHGHEFGIKSAFFNPTMDQIISVGLEHDNVVNVWSWPDKHRLATNKIVDVLYAVSLSSNGSFFVTAGVRHLKFWYPKVSVPVNKHTYMPRISLQLKQTMMPSVRPLYGRPGILGECKTEIFVDVKCGNGESSSHVFAITKNDGLIILLSADRRLKIHKKIEKFNGTCLKVQGKLLFIGFITGDINVFNAITLVHLAVLPVPTFFRCLGLDTGPVFSLVYNPSCSMLTALYENNSMCTWDLINPRNVMQRYIALCHWKSIGSLDTFATKDVNGCLRETIVTVSSDATVRLWGIVIGQSNNYDRLSILYTDENSRGGAEVKDAATITTVKVSPDQKYIVIGAKSGHISAFSINSSEISLTFPAHKREVTCLIFYPISSDKCVLISGSRDRQIHVMDVENQFRLISTLNIHSSSITSLVVFREEDKSYLISTAADRAIAISKATEDSNGVPRFHLTASVQCVSTTSDVAVDSTHRMLVLGCQDGNVRVLGLSLLQEERSFPGCLCFEAQVHKVCLDSPVSLLFTATSDRSINVINYYNGEILHSCFGHSLCVTGLAFSFSGDHVISTSTDGCIFLWKLSKQLLIQKAEILAHRASNLAKGLPVFYKSTQQTRRQEAQDAKVAQTDHAKMTRSCCGTPKPTIQACLPVGKIASLNLTCNHLKSKPSGKRQAQSKDDINQTSEIKVSYWSVDHPDIDSQLARSPAKHQPLLELSDVVDKEENSCEESPLVSGKSALGKKLDLQRETDNHLCYYSAGNIDAPLHRKGCRGAMKESSPILLIDLNQNLNFKQRDVAEESLYESISRTSTKEAAEVRLDMHDLTERKSVSLHNLSPKLSPQTSIMEPLKTLVPFL